MTKQQLGKIYERIVGYDITIDDPTITEEQIVSIMREYDEATDDDCFKKHGCY